VPDAWKRYPYVPDWGDPRQFTLPVADAERPDLGVSTYFVDGFLTGRTSGRQYAFMTIFTDVRVLRKLVRASFYTFALYDCDGGRYGTYTDEDFPRPPWIRLRRKLAGDPDHLALRYAASAGTARWENATAADGTLRPFAWTLDLPGVDHRGAAMRLVLDVDAARPPAPLGGRALGGEMMFLGIERTWSYFQSGLVMRGDVHWGDFGEEVEGSVGWIDRQWSSSDFSAKQDRQSTRFRNEWRVIQLDSGWDMSCFHQYHRPARNAVVPWSGLSAQGPNGEIEATADVGLEIPEFIRSPGVVRGRYMVTEGPRWFPARYRLTAPAWEVDLAATPLVEAPAHALPIEYWTGPVRIAGRAFGRDVTGLGFDERSNPWCRGWEIAAALRITAAPLDADLAYRASEVEALALAGDAAAAAAHCARHVAPRVAALGEAARRRVAPLAADLAVALSGRHAVAG
jgi:hypothetical protein